MIKRQTANDYRKELHKLELDRMAVEKRIRARFKELCKQNPNAFLSEAKVAQAKDVTEEEMISLAISSVLNFIEYIEDELASKHPHKQTKFNFTSVEVVPAPPVGERFIVSDGVAYSRKPEEEVLKCTKSPDGRHHFEHDGSTCSYCGTNVVYL